MNNESISDKSKLFQNELSGDIDAPQKKRRRATSQEKAIGNHTQNYLSPTLEVGKEISEFHSDGNSHVISSQKMKSIAVESFLPSRLDNDGNQLLEPKGVRAKESDLGSLLIPSSHRDLILHSDKDSNASGPSEIYRDESRVAPIVNVKCSNFSQSPSSLQQVCI
jgi:hypothetical protein